MRRFSVLLAAFVALATAAATPRAAATAPSYERVDLGSLGGAWIVPKALGEGGHVAGYGLLDPATAHAFRWSQTGGLTDLGMYGSPAAVNASGTIVGYGVGADGNKHAFAWTSTGTVDLGRGDAYAISDAGFVAGETNPGPRPVVWTPAGELIDVFAGATTNNGRAYGVNESGLVVGIGYANPEGSTFYGFSWTQGGGFVRLPGLVPGANSNAVAVNDAGQIVGISTTAQFRPHAVVWNPGGSIVDLGDLGGMSSIPTAINENGQVVGWSGTPAWFTHAFMWTAERGIEDLGTLGGPASQAADVNADGLVVGSSALASGEQHAFAWTRDDGMIDLGVPGETSTAIAVNDAGQILGYTGQLGVDARAVIWDAADRTPPQLTVPADIATDAASPSGAVVAFDVAVTDETDPSPSIACTPQSGATFPIGTTTVTCTATDASGNVATATFTVHVRGAAEQLESLVGLVKASDAPGGLTNSLLVKLETLDTHRLQAFVNEVEAQTDKALTQTHASPLVAAANRILAVLGG
jgi:probable HAF family extracellular repeat protein